MVFLFQVFIRCHSSFHRFDLNFQFNSSEAVPKIDEQNECKYCKITFVMTLYSLLHPFTIRRDRKRKKQKKNHQKSQSFPFVIFTIFFVFIFLPSRYVPFSLFFLFLLRKKRQENLNSIKNGHPKNTISFAFTYTMWCFKFKHKQSHKIERKWHCKNSFQE